MKYPGKGTDVGDGRYYTYDQFVTVLFLTMLLAGICIQAVISHFQGFKRQSRLIMAAHAALAMAAFMRFTTEVLVSRETALVARQAELICALTTEMAVLYLIGLGSSLSPRLFRGSAMVCLAMTGLLMAEEAWLIRTHSLTTTVFGPGYLGITGVIFFGSVATTFYSQSWCRTLLLFSLPLGVHLAGSIAGGPAGDVTLLLLYPFLLAGLHLFSAELRAYRIGDQAFSSINNLIDDAVILCDENRDIVYRNTHARKATFLKERLTTVPEDGAVAMVSPEMQPTHRFNIPAFSSVAGGQHIECRTQTVGKGQNSQFYIFTDISRQIEMLDVQEDQRHQLEEVNQKLRQYSHIVFDLEKEKEVASLLSDVTHTQDTFMNNFRERVEALARHRDPDTFYDRLEALIADARENLTRIRTLVARYRRYHGT